MRGRKKMIVEVGEETRAHMDALVEDIHALDTLVEELRDQARRIADSLEGQLAYAVENVDGTFNGAGPDETNAEPFDEPVGQVEAAPDSPFASEPTSVSAMTLDDPARTRSTPFTRTPRHMQVEWLRDVVLADGEWHAAVAIARREANDERHYRYLRSAISGRLREMWEEGLLDRRDSHARGSMFDYRLKP